MTLRSTHLSLFGSWRPFVGLHSDSNLHSLHPYFVYLSVKLESCWDQQSSHPPWGTTCDFNQPWTMLDQSWNQSSIHSMLVLFLPVTELWKGPCWGAAWEGNSERTSKTKLKKTTHQAHTRKPTTTSPYLETGWAEVMMWAGRGWRIWISDIAH